MDLTHLQTLQTLMQLNQWRKTGENFTFYYYRQIHKICFFLILLILSIIDHVIDQPYTGNIILAKISSSYQLDQSLLQYCQSSNGSVPWYRNYATDICINRLLLTILGQIFGLFLPHVPKLVPSSVLWNFIHALVLYTKS